LRLLVATDFSPSATEVMRVAAGIAKGVEAEVHILHVALPENELIGANAGKICDDNGIESNREEKKLVRESVDAMIAKGLTAHGEVVAGPCADVILAEADKLDVDMIVVGSHGFGAVLRVLLGSVSASILKKARCPVVVVPSQKTKRT
jgi:nucleotide-binding universal stress UspA family protein